MQTKIRNELLVITVALDIQISTVSLEFLPDKKCSLYILINPGYGLINLLVYKSQNTLGNFIII